MFAVLPSTISAEGIQRKNIVRLPITIANGLDAYGIIKRRHELLPSDAAEYIDIHKGLCDEYLKSDKKQRPSVGFFRSIEVERIGKLL
jgi:hypothetical protein